MSDELDFWNFADQDDAKAEGRAAVSIAEVHRRRPR